MSASWSCGACSTSNAARDARCVVCSANRPAAGAPIAPRAPQHDATVVMTAAPVVPVVERRPVQQAHAPVGGMAGTAASTTTYAGVPASDDPGGSKGRSAAIIAAFVIVALVVGVIAFLLVSGTGGRSDGSSPTTEYAEPDDTAEYDASPQVPEAVAPRDEPAVVATTPVTAPPVVERQARMWAGVAKVRSDPRLPEGGAPDNEVHALQNAEGMPITILGPMTDTGWYQVEVDGYQGYLYAGLVVPPEPGYCVMEMPDYWVDAVGSSRILARQNQSGDYSDYLEVILPNGEPDYVDRTVAKDVQCSERAE